MQNSLLLAIENCMLAIEQLKTPDAMQFIEKVSQLLATCFQSNHKVLIAGNGGSLCDATHFAEELTGFFRKKRRALPAIALAEPGHLTCVANDVGFDQIFSRGIEAYGQAGDVFIGLSTSGNSINLIHAFNEAKLKNMHTVAFLGKGGGKLKKIANFEWIVGEVITSDRIQEAHMAAMHVIIEQIEWILFNS